MTKNTLKRLANIALALVTTSVMSMADSYTWQGNGGDWSDDANWVGGIAPGGDGHFLFFDGETQTSTNDDHLTSVVGIAFNAGAGAFTLEGGALTLAGTIVNESENTQTITLDLEMSGDLIFDTRNGDITHSGILSRTAGNLSKNGAGKLLLSGNNTNAGNTYINRGTLEIRRSSAGSVSSAIRFGSSTASLIVSGSDTTLGALYTNTSVAGSIIADGVAVTIGSWDRAYTGQYGTVHFDISRENSSISVTGDKPTLTNANGSIYSYATIRDDEKIGFAGFSGNGIVRIAPTAAVANSGQGNVNTSLSGNFTLTNNRSTNSITITGSGTLSGGAGNYAMSTHALLVDPGVGAGGYRIATSQIGDRGGGSALYIHQYNPAGILEIDARIHSEDANYGLIKAGPGKVYLSEASVSSYRGGTYVQSGELEIDGKLTRTGNVIVYDGALLSGAGELGGTVTSTALTIGAGGTLSATTAKALDVTGTLAFNSESSFRFTLDSGTDSVNVTGAITLLENANLQLDLGETLALNTPIYLLRSDTGITGNFTYHNAVISDGATFTLGSYQFQYFQDDADIWVSATAAIPEPGVALLLGLGAAFLLLRPLIKRNRDT